MATEQLVISVSEKGTLTVKRKFDELGKSAQKAGSGVKLLRTALGALAAIGLTRVLTQNVRLLADFSQTLSTVKAVSGATEEQFAALRDEAKRLGATTRFSATDAAEGLLFLSRAGFTAEESLDSLEGTLKLAQAGALDLGTAADIASNVLAGFRGDTSKLNQIIDVLAKAANSSNTNVQQLGQGLKFVAPVAAGLGVTIEETAAAIGTLSDAGLQSTLAGTGLRKVLATLERPTSAAQKILKELGLTTKDVEVSQVGLVAALTKLRDAGIGTGQALALFGQRGGPAFDVLVNTIPDIERFTEKLQGSAGTADRIAKIMDENLNGALLAVRSAFQAVIIEFGELGAESALTQFMQGLAKTLRFVSENLENIGRAAAIAGVALGITFYQKGLLLANKGLLIALGRLKALGVVIAANPIGAMVTALGAVIALLTIFNDKITFGSENTANLGDVASVAFGKISTALSSLFAVANTGFDETGKKADSTGQIIGSALGAAALTIAQILDKTVGLITGIFGVIIFQAERLPGAIGDLLITAFNFWVQIIEDGINKIIQGINSVSGALRIPPIDEVTIGGIFNKFEGQAQRFGEDTGAIFSEAFNNTVAQDAVLGVLDEAQALALARQAGAATGTVAGGGAPVVEGAGAGTPTPVPEVDKYQQYIALLQQENDLLKLSTPERERVQALLEAKAEIDRALAPDEEQRLKQLINQNQQLAVQADLLEQIQGPQQQYQQYIALLQQENDLLKQSVPQRERNQALLEAKAEIERALTPTEEQRLKQLINQNQQLQLQSEILEQIRGPQQEYERSLEALNLLKPQLTAEEYAKGLELIEQNLQKTTETNDAFVQGVGSTFDAAKQSVLDFVETGKFAFADFASSALASIADIIAGLLRAQAIQAIGSAFGIPVPVAQHGLSFQVAGSGGTDSQLVAFRATPGEQVDVRTPAQQRAMAGPGPIVTPTPQFKIVNVMDPNEIRSAMAAEEGTQVILNTLTRNRSAARQVLS